MAGHTGLVGGALVRRLRRENCELVLVERDRLDLRDQLATRSWVAATRPDVIIIAAATVGGILANSASPADFLFDNPFRRGRHLSTPTQCRPLRMPS